MDVVLVHDPWHLPEDLYRAMQDAGHRVVSHGAELPSFGHFLDAMRWPAQAIVLDFRGRGELLDGVAAWLSATEPWRQLPRIEVGRDGAAVDPVDAVGRLAEL